MVWVRWPCTRCSDAREGGGGGNGCGPIDATNDVDPAGGTPAELATEGPVKLWRVKWDNPVVGDTSFEMPAGGLAERAGNGWVYRRFDITANELFGSQTRLGVATWPQDDGLYEGTFLAWEMHGVELTPRTLPIDQASAIQAVRDDCTSGEVLYKGVGLFQLDPNVAVVPIRVVVLHPTPFDDSFPADWVDESDAKLLFDDRWIEDKVSSSIPECNPTVVDGFWTYRAGCQGQSGCETVVQAQGDASDPIIQPDRIWDQCDIQFRMISYHQCEIEAQEFFNTGSCNATAIANTLGIRINQCGVPQDLAVRVVFTGTLIDFDVEPACPEGTETEGGYDAGNVFVTYPAYYGLGRVLAHELGHALGLGGHFPGSCASTDNLMCPFAHELGGLLTSDQCADAHTSAMLKHAFW